ncbi:MAG: alpha/beta hydrolase [Verrucomicrobia bacterium]|nr:alpha/beta hydrolase [Verrucomicrobiota bacterium]
MLKTLETDTLQIAYEESGDPAFTPVVLLHGFPDDPRAWDRVVAALSADGFRTIAPYLRGFGPTRFLHGETPRSGQQAALAYDLHGLITRLDLTRPILVGYDWGARAACTTAVLWPGEVGGLVPIGGYNVEDITLDRRFAPARSEYQAWYQWYFHTERGKAGLEQNRYDICRLLWELWSPNWRFDDADFDRTASSFDNPDFAEIVIHSYRHRYGAAPGDPDLEPIEQRLSGRPRIDVPAIVLHGEGDTIHPPERSAGHEKFFSSYYERQVIPAAGHLFPREAPEAVVAAVRKLASLPPRT